MSSFDVFIQPLPASFFSRTVGTQIPHPPLPKGEIKNRKAQQFGKQPTVFAEPGSVSGFDKRLWSSESAAI
jgi:hypothetical protein